MNNSSFDLYNTGRAVVATGDKGRPKLGISRDQLEYFLEKGFKGTVIAKMLRVRQTRQFTEHSENLESRFVQVMTV